MPVCPLTWVVWLVRAQRAMWIVGRVGVITLRWCRIGTQTSQLTCSVHSFDVQVFSSSAACGSLFPHPAVCASVAGPLNSSVTVRRVLFAAANVSREVGGSRIQDMDTAVLNRLDERRVEILADGFPLLRGAHWQWTPRCGVVLRRKKARWGPDFSGGHGGTQSLVLAAEVGGTWSSLVNLHLLQALLHCILMGSLLELGNYSRWVGVSSRHARVQTVMSSIISLG